jgi:CBS domain-containing protein
MQLKEIMRSDVEVVAPDTSLRDAAHKMSARRLAMLPVCVGPRIVGVLTPRDLTVRATSQGCDPQTGRVREVMTLLPVCGREDQEAAEAAHLMRRWRLPQLPVVNERQHLVGIVSLRDLKG